MLRVATLSSGLVVSASSGADAISSSETARVAVSALYEERGPEFLHFALALARDEELAKDALQEAFMRYFVALCEGRKIASPRAWIHRVVHNYLLDRMKEARPSASVISGEQFSRHDQEIERECFRREVLQLVRRALTSGEYKCLYLRIKGLGYNEIAAKLDVTTGTVGALLSRAVGKMRRVLAPIGGEVK